MKAGGGGGGGGGMILSEIIKAGSMGHGTAVPGHYDLDIVVYSESTYMQRFYGILKHGHGSSTVLRTAQ